MRFLKHSALFGAALLSASHAALSAELPAGRYRCYVPPSYTVTAWFDILPDGTYQFQGEPPARFSYDPATRRLSWLEGEFAASLTGATYHPPAAASPTGQRHAIVLQERPAAVKDNAPECYLTTH